MNKIALITGVTGQDGALLAEFLLKKEYEVFGMMRRTSSPTYWRLQELGIFGYPNFHTVSGDVTDSISLQKVMAESMPDEIYNLAAQSYVGGSWQNPISTIDITGVGAMRLYEAALHYQKEFGKKVKIYQASSSEMFGNIKNGGADENEPLYPRSPYGVAKCMAHLAAKTYRDSYGMFISCGILFNHESEYRGIEFVSRKITLAAARISQYKQDILYLGNIHSYRDFGYAPDYVEAMYLMLQQDKPNDFIIASREVHSIKEICEIAFNKAKIYDWGNFVRIATDNIRPNDIDYLCGNIDKAVNELNWKPRTDFQTMIEKMVDKDLERVKSGLI